MQKTYYELTNPQMRIIYNDIMHPELETANVGYLVNFKEPLDSVRLEKAWNEVLKRHNALRIQINKEKKKYNQYFKEYQYYEIETLCYSKIPNIVDYIKDKHHEKFDIFSDNLFYFACVHFNENESGFYIKFHHSVIDGISASLIVEEVYNIYYNLLPLKSSNSYVDFINYEEEYTSSQKYEKNRDYWINKFKDININTTLQKVIHEREFLLMNKIYIPISHYRYQKINNFIKDNNSSYFRLFSVAMAIYFERVKNENKILIGRAIHNRVKKEHRSIIGMFVSTTPLTVTIDSEQTIIENLKSVKSEIMKNMRHEKFPYNSLVNLLRKDKNSNVNSDFINILVSENPPINLNNIEIVEEFFPTYSNYEMSIALNPRNRLVRNEMEVAVDYSEEIFSKDQIKEFIERLHIIMENMINFPNNKIMDIEIISNDEKENILFNFNNTESKYQKDKIFIEFFEEQVKKTPNNKAISYEGGYLTYDEFNKKVNQLAWFLKSNGVTRNTIVPIMTERSVEMMIGIYAILKAGGAYLPIDSKFPLDRINYILEDCSANLILLKSKDNNLVQNSIKKIFIDSDQYYSEKINNLPLINKIEDLSYIIYTSGSTGNPKGVMIKNNNLLNHMFWLEKNYPTQSDDVILQKTSFTFDPSVSELLSWVLNGASLFLLKLNGEKNPDEIIETIYKENISIIRFVPSLMSIFFDNINSKNDNYKIKSLKYILVGGEALTKKHVQQFKNLNLKNTELVNLYGPTETTIEIASYNCNNNENEITIPIGKPTDNSKILILEKYKHILPIGIPGELCILGDGLAKGYLNRPDLTNSKFITSNFYNNAKMYKTGDLAKWRDDGNIDYLGRIDFQVKIRGFRIELGEIESKFSSLENIELVTVVDRENSKGNKYLAAYYTGKKYEVKYIRNQLAKTLPDYMIPSQFMHLDEMPLTISGKINRKALPVIEHEVNITDNNLTGSVIEDEIIMIWKDVLERDDITKESDFFVCGGDSLDAIRVVGRLSKAFNITINDMFEQKTVTKLASKIRSDQKNLDKSVTALKNLFYQHEKDKENNIVETMLKHEFHTYENYVHEYIESKKDIVVKKHDNILLTGTTGYLGAHLLYDLLRTTDTSIYTLVRGNNVNEAKQRLVEKFNFYFDEVDFNLFKNRIKVLCGDITKENLGLDESSLKLFKNIDCIINSAANVKHYGKYEDFYNVNVRGVENLIKLVKDNETVKFYHISTKSVGSGIVANTEYIAFNENTVDVGQDINNFYVRTKLEAEKLCVEARESGLNINIIRVGNLAFNSKSGKFQQNIEENAFYSRIKDMLKMGVFPATKSLSAEFSFEISYIDYVSHAISLLVSKGIMDNEIMHVYNPHSISFYEFGKHLKESGENIELLSIDEFFDYLKENYDHSELKTNIENLLLRMIEVSKYTKYTIKSDKSNQLLKNLGFEWKKTDQNDINRMISYAKDVGFF